MPLVLGGAPIGRPGDASPRLAEALGTAEIVAAEDTRRLHRLCADLGVTPTGRVVSCFEGNEERRVPELLAAVREGRTVLLVTDAGMPTVSDRASGWSPPRPPRTCRSPACPGRPR